MRWIPGQRQCSLPGAVDFVSSYYGGPKLSSLLSQKIISDWWPGLSPPPTPTTASQLEALDGSQPTPPLERLVESQDDPNPVLFDVTYPLLPWWLSWFDTWVGKIPWRRKWQPTRVFVSGRFHGQSNLVVHGVARVRHYWATKPHPHHMQLLYYSLQTLLSFSFKVNFFFKHFTRHKISWYILKT